MPAKPVAGLLGLAETLEAYKLDDLKGLAKHLGTYPPTRKADLVALIQERMADPQSLRQLWVKMSSTASTQSRARPARASEF